MSRTHRFTLGLGVFAAGLLAVLWANTDLSHDERVILLGSIGPLIYLQARGIEVRALPSSDTEPSVTVTSSLTEAVTVPMAALVDPAAAATLVAFTGLIAALANPRGQPNRGRVDPPLAVGSMSATAVNVLIVSVICHLILEAHDSTAYEVVAVVVGVAVLQLLGLCWDLALYIVSRRPLQLAVELELVHLIPLVSVLGSILLLAYEPTALAGAGTAMVLCLVLSESLRRFYKRTLELRRREADRGHLLKVLLESDDTRSQARAAALHDGPLQSVVSSKLRLETLLDEYRQECREAFRQELQSIVSALDTAGAELRAVMQNEIRAPVLDGTLNAALERERATFAPSFEDGAELEYSVATDLASTVELLVFQIVHEALVNAQRHARARRVTIGVRSNAGTLEIVVSDDGNGLDPHSAASAYQSGHIGLVTMRERTALAGGSLVLSTPESGGTTVRAVLPLTK